MKLVEIIALIEELGVIVHANTDWNYSESVLEAKVTLEKILELKHELRAGFNPDKLNEIYVLIEQGSRRV